MANVKKAARWEAIQHAEELTNLARKARLLKTALRGIEEQSESSVVFPSDVEPLSDLAFDIERALEQAARA